MALKKSVMTLEKSTNQKSAYLAKLYIHTLMMVVFRRYRWTESRIGIIEPNEN